MATRTPDLAHLRAMKPGATPERSRRCDASTRSPSRTLDRPDVDPDGEHPHPELRCSPLPGPATSHCRPPGRARDIPASTSPASLMRNPAGTPARVVELSMKFPGPLLEDLRLGEIRRDEHVRSHPRGLGRRWAGVRHGSFADANGPVQPVMPAFTSPHPAAPARPGCPRRHPRVSRSWPPAARRIRGPPRWAASRCRSAVRSP